MFRLHHVQYGRSFRILWAIEEMALEEKLGQPLELVEYQIGSKEMRESDLPRVSPAVRIPALELDGLEMSESGAIMQHLVETYAPELDRGVGHPDRPAFLQWIHYSETMASLIENLNLQLVFLRPPAKASPIVVKLTVARLRASLAGMEARLGDHDWLLPSGFSAADLMFGFNLFAAPYYVHLDEFPKLQAYKARIQARASYQRSCEREGEQRFYAQSFYPVPEA